MKKVQRTFLGFLLAGSSLAALAGDGVAFVTNLKGEVSVDGVPRPLLMSEIAKGQKIALAKDAQLSVMYIQSGKEFALKGPGDYTVGEREVAVSGGAAPAARETAWRASNQVLVKVAQSSAASIRMRSLAPPKVEEKALLQFPTQGAVASLQPTFRWAPAEGKATYEFTLAAVGREDKPVAKAKVTTATFRPSAKLQPDAEYVWTVSASGQPLGQARFRTLAAEGLQQAEKRRPSERADFTDRVMYAVLLQDLGATQEARDAWAKLAEERSDLPELASLAK